MSARSGIFHLEETEDGMSGNSRFWQKAHTGFPLRRPFLGQHKRKPDRRLWSEKRNGFLNSQNVLLIVWWNKNSITVQRRLLCSSDPVITMAKSVPTNNMEEQMKLLHHFSYNCPGIHGAGSKQTIVPKTFKALFEARQIIIPLFQRTYCWGKESLIATWWRDLVQCGRDHRVGKIVFKKSEVDDALLCIDGQQRITTNTLLLSAFRDAALQVLIDANDQGDHDAASKARLLADKINAVLYHDPDASNEWVEKAADRLANGASLEEVHQEGESLPFCRLIPSFVDRGAFFESIMFGPVRLALRARANSTFALNVSDRTANTHQGAAKLAFDQYIERYRVSKDTPLEKRLVVIDTLVRTSLCSFTLMYIELMNEVNLSQVFLWLQEKSLFSMGALLFNPTPGIDFRGSDMCRNLVLAPHLDKKLEDQERIYRDRWLEPMEFRFPGPQELDKLISEFVDHYVEQVLGKTTGPKGSFTQAAEAIIKMVPSMAGKPIPPGVFVYGRFQGLHEELVNERMEARKTEQMLPPPPKKDNSDQKKNFGLLPEVPAKSKLLLEVEDEVQTHLLGALAEFADKRYNESAMQ